MALVVVGINYQTAPVELRSHLVFDRAGAVEAAIRLVQEGFAREAVVVSTCHRTEFYCEAESAAEVLHFIHGMVGLHFDVLSPCFYKHVDFVAVMHLMRVATGLDSMVLGEAEIFGQIKEAYSDAVQAGALGKHLGRLFQTAFAIAKTIRARTGVGVNPISVAYAAAKLSQQWFLDLNRKAALLIGAGNLIRLTALHLKEKGIQNIKIANRSIENAKNLAKALNAEGFGLESIPNLLPDVDIVISGTASIVPLVDKTMVLASLARCPHHSLFMVDLSVPPNIEPSVGTVTGVSLYGLDDLHILLEDNRKRRFHAAVNAENIIEKSAEQFMSWLQAQESFKILCGFRKKFHQTSHLLLEEGLKRLQMGEDPAFVLKRVMYRLSNRFLHTPTKRLRLAGLEQEEALLNLTKDLFELNHETIYTD